MSQNLPEQSLRIFCRYVILTISYLRAQTIETSSLPTDSSRPLFKQIEIFSTLMVWLYISTVSTFLNNERVTRVPRWDFAFWAKSLRGLQMKDGEILHPWKTWIQKFCTALFSAKFTFNTTTNEWCKNSAFLKDLDVKIMHGLIFR